MNEKENQNVNQPQEFNKVLNKFDIFAIAFGAMIGWGWVIMAGIWIMRAGSFGSMAAFAVGGVMVIFVGLTYAELTAAIPETGGAHVFSHRAFGAKTSYVCSWSLILGYVGVVAFESVAFPTVVQYLFPNFLKWKLYTIAGYDVYLTWLLTGVIAAGLIMFLNYRGTKDAAKIQNLLTIFIFLIGVTLIAASVVNGNSENLKPFWNNGAGGIFAVAIMTPFMFVGFDVIPQAAEEINVPAREIGKIMILSIVLAASWYIFIILAVSLIMTYPEMDSSLLVTADAMKKVFNNSTAMANVLVIGGLAGIITSWNSFFMGGSRAIYAMAHSKMLPKALGELHPVNKTPKWATILIGIIAMAAPFFGRQMMVWLTNAGGAAIVLAYFIVALSFLKLRKSEPDLLRPYKVSNGTFVGVGAVFMSAFMLALYIPGMPGGAGLTTPEIVILGVWVLIGGYFYFDAKRTYSDFGVRDVKAIEEALEETI